MKSKFQTHSLSVSIKAHTHKKHPLPVNHWVPTQNLISHLSELHLTHSHSNHQKSKPIDLDKGLLHGLLSAGQRCHSHWNIEGTYHRNKYSILLEKWLVLELPSVSAGEVKWESILELPKPETQIIFAHLLYVIFY